MFKQIDTVIELTKTGYKAIDHKKGRHYAAIGKLIVTVSTEIDGKLSSLLTMQINSGEEAVTRILIGEMRTGDVMAALKRIAHSRNLSSELLVTIDDLFFEIGELRHVRDIVAHRVCMVKGSRFAFHNAHSAKTDSAIEVSFYTISELNEFSAYAIRLSYRIGALQSILVPVYMAPRKQAALALIFNTILATAASHMIKEKNLSRENVLKLKTLSSAAYTAVKAYTAAIQRVDENFADFQQAASQTAHDFAAKVLSLDAPEGPALREIPSRLQRKRRSQRRGIAPSQQPRLPASRE